jgi:hypothetical protein
VKYLNLSLGRGLVIMAGLFLSHPLALAAFSNPNSLLLGERAAGMGGAFTALSGDPAALPYYNPGGLVFDAAPGVSASASAYVRSNTQIGEQDQKLESPERINRGFFRSVPISSSALTNWRDLVFAMSIIVPDHEQFSGVLRSDSQVNATLSQTDESIWVGASAARELSSPFGEGSRQSVGVSLYYTARSLHRTATDRSGTGASTVITLEEKYLVANSVVGILGWQLEQGPWRWGASLRPPSLPYSGEATYSRSRTVASTDNTTRIAESRVSARDRVPSRLALGVGWQHPNGREVFSVDLQFQDEVDYRDMDQSSGAERTYFRRMTNIAFGYESKLDAKWTFRLGAYTNRSTHEGPSDQPIERTGDQVDQLGWSANLRYATSPNTFTTFGGFYSGGRGTSVQRIGDALMTVPKSQHQYVMLVSSGFRF